MIARLPIIIPLLSVGLGCLFVFAPVRNAVFAAGQASLMFRGYLDFLHFRALRQFWAHIVPGEIGS